MRRRSRALLSILGIMFNIALLVGILAVSQSVEEATLQPMKSAGADMLVQFHGKPCAFDTIKLVRDLNPMPADALKLDTNDGVSAITGVLEFLAFKEGHPTIITGIDPDITNIGPIKPTQKKGACCEIVEGRYLQGADTYTSVIDKELAILEGLKIGSKIDIGQKDFEVVGIMDVGKAARISGAQVFIPINTAKQIVNRGNIITTIFVKLSNKADPKVVKEKIKSVTDKNVSITTNADFLTTVAGMSAMTKNMAAGVTLIVIIIVTLFIIKSSLATIYERKKEIGIMKAVGWQDMDVAKLITIENVIQSLIGGIIGCFTGYMITYLYAMNSKFAIPKAITSYPACASTALATDLTVNIVFSPLLILIGMLVAVVLGFLAGYVGAKKISSLLPAEALRQL
ncbi:MAG: ABC transporter permease [Planctomycetota bacterium]|nr:ABC transporter permease [Planctomycetota bacterium]